MAITEQQQDKSNNLINPKTLSLTIVILLIGLIIYGIVNNKDEQHNKTPVKDDIDNENQNKIPLWLWILFGLGISMYIFKTLFEHDWSKPKRIKVDEFVNQVHIPRLIRQGFINGIYNNKLKHPTPQGCDVSIGDARPLSETGTGSRTWIAEIEMYNNNPTRWDGVHTVMVNLDNPKEDLEQGDYALFWHIDWIRFVRDKSYRRKLPFVTPEDEQMKMLQLLGDSGQYNKEEITSMMMQRYNAGRQTPNQGSIDQSYGEDPNRLYSNEETGDAAEQPMMPDQNYNNYSPAVNRKPYKKKRRWF